MSTDKYNMNKQLQRAIIKAIVVLIPTYTTAYLTGKMIYVVPMLAASAYIAADIFGDEPMRNVENDAGKDSKDDIEGSD